MIREKILVNEHIRRLFLIEFGEKNKTNPNETAERNGSNGTSQKF
jgi:hypothetical protein